MTFEKIENKHKSIIEIAKKYMNSINDKEHDINHMEDVVNYTKELLEKIELDIDKEVCIISAYWHDVGRCKDSGMHEKISAEMLKEELEKNKYDNEFISKCYQAIENHKWNMNPKTVEGLLIKDADKLSWIGPKRWLNCIENKQNLDEIVKLLPRLKKEFLHFEESKKIYDRDIVNLVGILYKEMFHN